MVGTPEPSEAQTANALVLCFEERPEVVWGDGWSLHAKGCRNTKISTVQFECEIDTVEEGVFAAFGDFMEGTDEEGLAEYSRYLRVCPCALKVIAAQNGTPFVELS